nr:hypothetical protein [Pararcticibacter amylolyticus]
MEHIKKDRQRHYKKNHIPDDFKEPISSGLVLKAEGIEIWLAIGGCQKNAPNRCNNKRNGNAGLMVKAGVTTILRTKFVTGIGDIDIP